MFERFALVLSLCLFTGCFESHVVDDAGPADVGSPRVRIATYHLPSELDAFNLFVYDDGSFEAWASGCDFSAPIAIGAWASERNSWILHPTEAWRETPLPPLGSAILAPSVRLVPSDVGATLLFLDDQGDEQGRQEWLFDETCLDCRVSWRSSPLSCVEE